MLTNKFSFGLILSLLLTSTSVAWGQTTGPALPTLCPDLSAQNSSFNPNYWQLTLAPLADSQHLQQNLNITQIQANFESALWSNYISCRYSNNQQGDFTLQSKFVTTSPTQQDPHWQTMGSVIICVSKSNDVKDCPFTALRMIPTAPPTPQPLNLKSSLPDAPLN